MQTQKPSRQTTKNALGFVTVVQQVMILSSSHSLASPVYRVFASYLQQTNTHTPHTQKADRALRTSHQFNTRTSMRISAIIRDRTYVPTRRASSSSSSSSRIMMSIYLRRVYRTIVHLPSRPRLTSTHNPNDALCWCAAYIKHSTE